MTYSTDMHTHTRALNLLPVICAAGAGLVAVFLSSSYAQHFPLREGPLPFRYPPAAIGTFLVTGMLLVIAVVLRADLFWPLLVGTAIITGGMFVLNFPVFDEWLAGCLMLGAAAAVARGAVPPRPGGQRRWWVWLFIGLSLYLLAEGVRGLVLYHNLKAARPIIDAAIIFGIGVLLARYDFPRLADRRTTTFVAASGAIYLALYLLHGVVFSRLVFGFHVMEGVGGAERAYATFPIALTIPAAVLLLRFDQGWRWWLGLCALVLAVDVSFLSGSRAALLATVVLFTLASLRGGLKLAVQLWLSFFFAYAIVVVAFHYDSMYLIYRAESILDGMRIRSGSTNVVVFRGAAPGRPAEVPRGDTNRHILNKGALVAITLDPRLFLFGAGSYGYWPQAGKSVRELKARYGITENVVNYGSTLGPAGADPPRPPAWPVFIAETGAVGILLIFGNVLFSLGSTLVRPVPAGAKLSLQLGPVMVAASLLALLAWGYFAEIQTKVLWYLMMMPYGVLDSWSVREAAEDSRPEAAKGVGLPEPVALP